MPRTQSCSNSSICVNCRRSDGVVPPSAAANEKIYPAVSFAGQVLSIMDTLPAAQRQQLKRRVHGAIKNPDDMRALRLELSAATHSRTRGYRVSWPEMSGEVGFRHARGKPRSSRSGGRVQIILRTKVSKSIAAKPSVLCTSIALSRSVQESSAYWTLGSSYHAGAVTNVSTRSVSHSQSAWHRKFSSEGARKLRTGQAIRDC